MPEGVIVGLARTEGPASPKPKSALAAIWEQLTAFGRRIKALEERPAPERAKDGVGIRTLMVNAEGHLISVLTDGQVLDLGRVVGRDAAPPPIPEPKPGKDGRGISEIDVIDRHLVVALTDGSILDLGRVVGEDGSPGRSVDMAVVEQTMRQLVDRAVAALPRPKDGESVTVNDVAPMILQQIERAVAALPKPKDGNDGRGVTAVRIDDAGHLIVTLSDESVVDAGLAVKEGKPGTDGRGVDHLEIDNGELVVVLTDKTRNVLGRIKGEDGKPGKPGLPGKPGKVEQIEASFGPARSIDPGEIDNAMVRDLTIGDVTVQVICRN